jgi:hypothetical protein
VSALNFTVAGRISEHVFQFNASSLTNEMPAEKLPYPQVEKGCRFERPKSRSVGGAGHCGQRISLLPKFKILKIEIRNFVRGWDFIDFNNGISIEMVKVNFLACIPPATFVEIGGVSVLASLIVLVLSPDPMDRSTPGRQASG